QAELMRRATLLDAKLEAAARLSEAIDELAYLPAEDDHAAAVHRCRAELEAIVPALDRVAENAAQALTELHAQALTELAARPPASGQKGDPLHCFACGAPGEGAFCAACGVRQPEDLA